MAKVAFIFPGQGSQSVGMLKEMAEVYSEVKEHFEQASEALQLDLWDIAQNDPNHQLGQTAITQPILLTASIACQKIITKQLGIYAEFMAGHSLGEYSALCAAQAIDFIDAVELVHQRGKIMQEAVGIGEGSMAAILGLPDEDVINVCNSIEGAVSAANFNAPGQVVIAGEKDAVAKAVEAANQAGAKKAVLLTVSVPSHCDLMRPAAAQFSTFLDKVHWHRPKATIIHNVDGKTHVGTEAIKSALGAQLYQPVRWVECVQTLVANDVSLCIEVGAGKVLTGLNKRIDRKLTTLPFDQPQQLDMIAAALEEK